MRFWMLLALGLGLVACESEKTENNTTPVNNENPSLVAKRQAVVTQAATTISGTYGEFVTTAKALETAAEAWVNTPSETTQNEVRVQFHAASDVWQRAEVMIVGPAGVMGDAAGGRDLRDKIYSWPLTNVCRVDQEIVNKGYEGEKLAAQTINVFGLDAFEYLAFHDAESNACPINSTINSEGTWAALGAEEVNTRRRAYALAVAKLLVSHAEELEGHWKSGAEFRTAFESPQMGGIYGSTREVLNALTDALFYVEKDVKDMKLARPIGVMDCVNPTCPEALESRYAKRSLANIQANLAGVEAIFTGGEGQGFDDLLTEVGATETRDELKADLAAAKAKAASFSVEMDEALVADKEGLQELYDLVRNLSTLLKTEFITVLDLDLPKRAEGDND